jgi:hypothetical protein
MFLGELHGILRTQSALKLHYSAKVKIEWNTSYLTISWPRFIEPRSETKSTLAIQKPATLGLKEAFCFKKLFGKFSMCSSVPNDFKDLFDVNMMSKI